MEGLEAVIASPATMEDGFKTISSQEERTYDDDTPTSLGTEDESYQIGEHIAANFSDGFYVGGTLEKIDDSTYRVSTADYNKHNRIYWYCSSKKDIFDTNTSCILNLRPVISISTPPSTKRLYIFACYNAELPEITTDVTFM